MSAPETRTRSFSSTMLFSGNAHLSGIMVPSDAVAPPRDCCSAWRLILSYSQLHDAIRPEAHAHIGLDQEALPFGQPLVIDEGAVARAQIAHPHAFGADHQLGVPAGYVRVLRQLGGDRGEPREAPDIER